MSSTEIGAAPAGVAVARPAPASTARAGRAATLLSTAGDEAATALLPGFLAGSLGAAPIALGLIEGAASAADGVARLGGGALAEDPRRRRRISFGSHAGITALTGLMAIASSSWQVGALRAGASTARGLRSPQRYASVPERAGSDGYGRLFGMERSLHHLAAVAGPALAFVLLTLVGIRSALLGSVVPGVLAVAIGLWVLRRAPAPARRAGPPARLQVRAVYSGRLGRLMTGITLFEAANFAAVLLILRATKLLEQGDVPFGPAAMAVLLYLLWRLAAAGSSFVCGRLVDRHGPAPVMSAGVSALLVAYAGFAFVEGTVPELALCFLGAGAASGAIEAAEHVGVAQIAPENLRWSAFGSLSAVRSFGRMTATMGAAAVWTLLGPEFGLLFAAPLMVASIVVMATGLGTRVRPRAPRRRWLVVPAVVVAAAAVLLTGREKPEDVSRAADPAAPLAADAPEVAATIRVGRSPAAIAVDAGTGRVIGGGRHGAADRSRDEPRGPRRGRGRRGRRRRGPPRGRGRRGRRRRGPPRGRGRRGAPAGTASGARAARPPPAGTASGARAARPPPAGTASGARVAGPAPPPTETALAAGPPRSRRPTG